MSKTIPHRFSVRDIDIGEYAYPLPEDRIARFPLQERDASKLLVFRDGSIRQRLFRELAGELPKGALLVFNNTRVIHARLPFRRPTGARIEVFCLEPLSPAAHTENLSSEKPVVWKCLIGNNKRWKKEELEMSIHTPDGPFRLFAEKLEPHDDAFAVRFRWAPDGTAFGALLHEAGLIPLPPYLKRKHTPQDEDRYQTVYACHDGSVAAPTAGLHFTDRVLQDLHRKDIQTAFVTLHVGAGTFQPVKSKRLGEHRMHEEHISVSREFIKTLIHALEEGRPVIPVGTTSMRTVESLYWWGLRNRQPPVNGGTTKFIPDELQARSTHPVSHATALVPQWAPYECPVDIDPSEALRSTLAGLEKLGLDLLTGPTGLLIAPGYRFRICRGLITNFHQPHSTLLLLIAALVGDQWRRIHDYALDNDFRFLSYGDSCLLMGRED